MSNQSEQPPVPPLSTFIVRRYDPTDLNLIETLTIRAHGAEHGAAMVRFFRFYLDPFTGQPGKGCVKCLHSFIDYEEVIHEAPSSSVIVGNFN
jgi:hypothetical protein